MCEESGYPINYLQNHKIDPYISKLKKQRETIMQEVKFLKIDYDDDNVADDDPPNPDLQKEEIGQPYWIQTSGEDNHHHAKEGMSLFGIIRSIPRTEGHSKVIPKIGYGSHNSSSIYLNGAKRKCQNIISSNTLLWEEN
jgi:hypothetical protein